MIERQTARKCKISQILSSRFVKGEGFDPGFIETPEGNISRANIFGIVLQKEPSEIIADDGTGIIPVRAFTEGLIPNDLNPGDSVIIIGKPREFSGQKYVMCEIVKKLDPAWLKVRKLELESGDIVFDNPKNPCSKDAEVLVVEESIAHASEDANPQQQSLKKELEAIKKAIKEIDNGKGALFDDVLARLNDPGAEAKIIGLIEAGEIFEITPGRIKLMF